MGLAEGVPADDQRGGLLVVHRHPAEGLADVDGRGERIRIAVGPFGIDVDQAHLHGCERVGEVAFAAVAPIGEPFGLRAPVHLFGLPFVRAAERETECLEAHCIQCDIAGEDQQVGPGKSVAVLLLDRPQQTARLVQAHVVRPAVERAKRCMPAPAPPRPSDTR